MWLIDEEKNDTQNGELIRERAVETSDATCLWALPGVRNVRGGSSWAHVFDQHYSASPSDRSLKSSQELLLSLLCKHKLIRGLFALVWLKKGQKASTDYMYMGQKSTLN